MKNTKTISEKRICPKLGVWVLFFVLLGSSCTPAVIPISPEPSLTSKPNTPTSTITHTPTSTVEPTPIPSPTQIPTPDWESITAEQLLEDAPEKEGYVKDRIVAHDSGRYVTYRNNETGMVEWVFNTENQAFERGAESVWRPVVGENGETAEIRSVVVTSKELEDRFGGYFKIDEEDGEKLSRYLVTNCAVDWYSKQNPGRFQDTAQMSDAQKSELVQEAVGAYLYQVVGTGSMVELHGLEVNPNQFIIKFDYQSGIAGSSLFDYRRGAVQFADSSESGNNLVMTMRSGQNMLTPMEGQGQDENYNIINVRAYWPHGPLLIIGNLIIENDVIVGRVKWNEEPESSLYDSILQESFGNGNYSPAVDRPGPLYANLYPGLPSLQGDWIVGNWVRSHGE